MVMQAMGLSVALATAERLENYLPPDQARKAAAMAAEQARTGGCVVGGIRLPYKIGTLEEAREVIAKAKQTAAMNQVQAKAVTGGPSGSGGQTREITVDEWKWRMALIDEIKGEKNGDWARQEFYRATIQGRKVPNEVRARLDDGENGGEHLLPRTLAERIILDYPDENPLRRLIRVTMINGLEEPILRYVDPKTANDLQLTGDSITFQRKKMRVFAPVMDTVLHGTTANLADTIEEALSSALLAREREKILTTMPAAGEEHMSVYSPVNGVPVVTGANKYEAIENALEDLPQSIRNRAGVVLSFADFKAVVKHLGTIGLGALAANPDLIFNKPLLITDEAVDPIVGDLSVVHVNYHWMMLDNDKEASSGQYTFALAADYDIRIAVPQALRIARVS